MANEFKVKKGLIVHGSGSTVLDIQGSQGQLFSITDDLTGTLFAVSDISGVPIFDVNADGTTTLDGNLTQTSGSVTFGNGITLQQTAGSSLIETSTSSMFIKASNIQTQGNLIPDADSSRNLGATNRYWENLYADNLHGDGSNLTNVTATSFTETDTLDSVTGRGATTTNNITVGTIGSGAITSTGKITGTELEGTSLDINGNADISGDLVIAGNIKNNVENGTLDFYGGTDATNDAHIRLHGNNTQWGSLYMDFGYDATNSKFIVNQGGTERFKIQNNVAYFSGKIQGAGEIEGTSLDINGNADISGILYGSTVVLDNTAGTRGIFRNNTAYDLRLGGGTVYSDGAYISLSGGTRGGGTSNTKGRVEIYSGGSNYTAQADITGDIVIGTQWNGGSSDIITLDSSTNNATFAGRVMADTHFQSSDTNATLSATGTGNVYLRPNGYSTSTGQVHIATSGNATFAGNITVNNTITTPTDTNLSLSPSGTGHVYFGNAGNGMKLYHYSQANDGKYTGYDFNGSYYRLLTSATSGVKIANPLYVSGNTDIQGDLTVSGKVTAQEFHTEFVSASIIYESGSTKFGDTSDDNHDFTGSINIKTGDVNIDSGRFLTMYGNGSTYHGIGSVDQNANSSDDIRINSYHNVYIDLDSNNNNTDTTTFFQISQHSAASTLNTPFFKVRGDGRVGINEDNPDSVLHINTGTGTGNANTVIIDRAGSSDYSGLSFATAGTIDWSIGQNSAGNFELFENGADATTRLTVETGGKVGIGIASPVAKLHVYQNDTEVDTEAGVTIEQDGTGDAALSFLLTATKRWRLGIDNSDSDKFKISDSTNLASSNRFTIDTSGNVGIGTTSPSAKLQILDNAEQPQLRVGADASNYLDIKAGSLSTSFTATGSGFISPDINFNTNGTKLSINGLTGFVGIGTSTPSDKLHVDGNIRLGGNIIGAEAVTLIKDVITDQSYEGQAYYNPETLNAFAGAHHWATVTVTNAKQGDRTTALTDLGGNPFRVGGNTAQIYFDTSETEIVIEIDHTAEPLRYHGVVGMQFTNTGWRPERVKIEGYNGSTWTTGLDITNNSEATVAAKIALGGAGIQKTKFTLGNPANSSGGYMRISKIFGYDYKGVSSHDAVKSGTYYINRYDNSAHYSTIYPATDSTYDLGTSALRYANIYADNLYGDGSNITNISATDSTKLPLAGGTMNSDASINMNSGQLTSVDYIDFGIGQLNGESTSNFILKSLGDITYNVDSNDNGDSAHIFQESGNELMRIRYDGKVGIGESSPAARLHIVDDTQFASGQASVEVLKLQRKNTGGDIKATTEGHISMWATDSNNNTEWGRISWVNDNAADGGLETEGAMSFWTSKEGTLTRAMYIDHDQRVGIGNTNPSEKLEVNGAVKAEAFVKLGGTSSQFLKADGSVDSTTYTGDQDLSGYLLNTTDTLTGILSIANTNFTGLSLTRNSTNGSSIDFNNSNGLLGRVGFLSNGSLAITNGGAGTSNMLDIDSSGNATFSGDITLGANHIGRDADNYVGFETDNQIKFRVNGATQVKLIDGALNPQTDSDIDLGTNTLRYKNIYADNIYGSAQDLAVTSNDTFSGTYSLLWHDGADVYSSSWLTVAGATDTLNVPNISTTGDVEVSGYFQVNSSAALLKKYVSGWDTGVQTHDIIYNGWNSSVSDYTYLKAAGNSTGGHGIIVAGDTGTYMGTTDIETGVIANSATAPLTNTWAYFRDTTAYIKGDTSFAGDVVVAGTVTAQEFHTEFVSASIMYESGSTKFGDSSDDVHNFTGSVNIDGTLSATVKSFDIDHPTIQGKRLVYGVLEGPEHAVYVRGESKEDTVRLPEEWKGLVDKDTLTVQLTPIGSPDIYYYENYENNSIVVGGPENKHYFYYVQATRKDVEPLITVQ